jgi:hypothetical protein
MAWRGAPAGVAIPVWRKCIRLARRRIGMAWPSSKKQLTMSM